MDKTKLKNIAVVAVLVAVFSVFGAGKYFGWFDATTTQSPTSATKTDGGIIESAKRAVGISGSTSTVSVELPPEPVGGVAKGVVEVGATGFNSFVVVVDAQGRYKVRSKKFGISLVREGMASEKDIREGLKEYLNSMSDLGVSGKNLHFVVSSGAMKDAEKMAPIVNALKDRGYVVNVVTPEQEGIFAFKAAMNPAYKDKAFVVDVGSGNTKISWYEGGGIRTAETAGSKYYLAGTSDSDVFGVIKEKASQVPANKREFCFVIGGVPNTLAKQHGSNDNHYIPLNPLDSYNAGDDKRVASGLNILKAIQAGTGVKYFVFDNNANFTIGFLASLK